MLVIVGGNPVYTAPADLQFADAMGKVPLRVHLEFARRRDVGAVHTGTCRSRTSSRAGATLAPSTARSRLCSRSSRRSTRRKSAHELLATFGATPEKTGYDQVREYWIKNGTGGGDKRATPEFEAAWRRWLHDGIVPDTAFAAESRHAARRRGRRVVPGATAGTGHGHSVPDRSRSARRSLRQQRLAAGAAEAHHQADVGQRRLRVAADRRGNGHLALPVDAGRRAWPDRQRDGRAPLQGPLGARARSSRWWATPTSA